MSVLKYDEAWGYLGSRRKVASGRVVTWGVQANKKSIYTLGVDTLTIMWE